MRLLSVPLLAGLLGCAAHVEETSREACVEACNKLVECYGSILDIPGELDIYDYGIPGFESCPNRCEAGNGFDLVRCASEELELECPLTANALTCGGLRSCLQDAYDLEEPANALLRIRLGSEEHHADAPCPAGDCGPLDCQEPQMPTEAPDSPYCETLGAGTLWISVTPVGTRELITTATASCVDALAAETAILVPPGRVHVAVSMAGNLPDGPVRGGEDDTYCWTVAHGTVDVDGSGADVVLPLRSAEQTLMDAATNAGCVPPVP